jgi:manganese oxidase
MRTFKLILLLALAASGPIWTDHLVRGATAERIAPNDNHVSAGVLRDGVLSLSIEATLATWHPDGDSLPGLTIEAFGEEGHAPSAPGPFVRVPAGTELRFRVRNSLERDTLTFYIPARIAAPERGTPADAALDSLVLVPGEARELRTRAARPGNYVYYANGRSALDRVLRVRGLLAGAIIIDTAGAPPPRDRVFVLLDATDSVTSYNTPVTRREVTGINGRSWPHTERLTYVEGDTVRWRILNASPGVHPMHLHGFYFRVDAFDGSPAAIQAASPPGRTVVTERMAPFTSMALTWVPERPGNWLFHCHFQSHAAPHRPLGPSTSDTSAARGHEDHATRGMGGLVMGVEVRSRGLTRDHNGGPASSAAAGRRT